MFTDPGCHGRVRLGTLPDVTRQRLGALPGEWLEYDAAASAIVVRHVQPTAAPSLPTIAGELVRFIAEIPARLHAGIAGGDLHVHTDGAQRLVRLRVEPGGAVHVRWAHPEYDRSGRTTWQRGAHGLVEPRVQRLNGDVTLTAADAAAARRHLEHVADTFEGLYPEGTCEVTMDDRGRVRVRLQDVNLDAELLALTLRRVADPGSLEGRVDVTSFASEAPEHDARFVFEGDATWIQRPVLWQSES